MKETVGLIHSLESFGAVDGPGLRFVIFLQGCKLRCLYCHNPDTWEINTGKEMTTSQLINIIKTYKSFIQNGGVTISGGEPLLQPEFCTELTQKCHEKGFHVAIDTAGSVPLSQSQKAIEEADMLLLDIKDIDSDDCKTLTGFSNNMTLSTLDFCESINKDVWIRHVLVPDYTLNDEKLHRLGNYLKNYKCIKKIELLPYHNMGLYKWEIIGIKNKLENTLCPTNDEILKATEILKQYNLPL